MSTTHGQPGLSSDQRSTIRSAILSTRHTLEAEIRRQLEKYGIHEAKKLPLDNLTHLSAEEIHTRRTLDAAIERELESTDGNLERSISNYVREATKTYLNRFVALKSIEVRGLVEETITEQSEYGNRSYMHHTVAEIAGELTNSPDDGYSAALDLAYQEIGAEIRMIFEESEHTAIDLDVQVREEVLNELDAIPDDAWESDEALGWVYQYFGEDEREEIDERVSEENYKIAGTDIATKTQLFTPRYIVEWMVDNSLGRTWLEMQGERTNIDDEENCFYLAPLEDSLIDREAKPVEEITVLDPACGSGHMLFYAFDVLYQMYMEEGDIPEKYIPREILQNNLYGIDIDSGAAEIAALSLYLKAKDHSPDVMIPHMNIVSADAVLINGDRKQEVVNRARSELEEKILEQIWRSFTHLREWGSLIRIEDRIEEILDEHKESIEAAGQTNFTDEGSLSTQSSFISSEGDEETWVEVKNRLLKEITEIASEALVQNNPIEELFVGEVEKTVELIDVLLQEYNVVISNPPYLNSRRMNEPLKQFLKDNYHGHRDLYTSFIQRASEMVVQSGYTSLVTPENFMTQYSYRSLRKWLVQNQSFIEGAHLSGHSFSMKDRPFTIPFLLRNSRPDSPQWSRFYRLTHEQDEYQTHEDTIRGLADVSQHLRQEKDHKNVYLVDQMDFDEIERRPFLYWFGREILNLFQKHQQLSEIAVVKKGISTGDDDRFVRKWWEVPESEIGETYHWFVLTGEDFEYYYSTENLIKWESSGNEIRQYNGSVLRNEEFYGKEGILFRDFSKYFTSMEHPAEWFFSDSTRFIYPDNISEREALLGYLCSSPIRFIMEGFNPGLHFNVGDANRIPVSIKTPSKIAHLTQKGTDRQKEFFSYEETKPEFEPIKLFQMPSQLLYKRDQSKADVLTTHGKIDEIVLSDLSLSRESCERIYEEMPQKLSNLPQLNGGKVEVDSESKRESDSVSNVEQLLEDLSNNDRSLREFSETHRISPHSIVEARYKEELYASDEKKTIAGRIVSCLLGIAFGRWTTDSIDRATKEEILSFNSPNGIPSIEDVLNNYFETIWDDENKVKNELESFLNKKTTSWVKNNFFRHHHVDEYKRRGQRIPIYWQLESTNGSFSCFVYYHGIDANTLPKLRGQYLDSRINKLENELKTLNAQIDGGNPDKDILNRKEQVQYNLDDIREFRETIDEMIDDGVTVDIEKGIWENIKEWDQYEVLQTGLPKLKSSYSR